RCAGAVSSSHCSGVLAATPLLSLSGGQLQRCLCAFYNFRGPSWIGDEPVSYNSRVNHSLRMRITRFVACAIAIAAITAMYTHIQVNPTTVALSFLVIVLVTAAFWGFKYSVF